VSRQTATNDDAAANEEEVEEQIEKDNVKKAARENVSGVPNPIMRGIEEKAAVDDAVAAGEEVQEQVERIRAEQRAFENRISVASAEKWIRNGGTRG
jgi:hypothetical protein